MNKDSKEYMSHKVKHYREGSFVEERAQDLVREEPLLIRVEGRPYSVVMRTPGNEVEHAAGFCFSEGLIETPGDIATIGFCSEIDENSITVALDAKRKELVADKLARQNFISQTSCGICGKELIDDLVDNLKPMHQNLGISYNKVFECVEKFSKHQKYYMQTRGTHAVMLFDSNLEIIAKAEDVGRHNAMDKSIGALFLDNRLPEVFLAVLSSRVSFEMIQKAARAGIPILISMSNPTSMAVQLGAELNMTLICLDKESGFIVPCGEERIDTSGVPPARG